MKKFYRGYCLVEKYITAAAFFMIIALTFFNTVMRIFNHPIVWCDDISLLLFSWCAFLGADVALRSNRLVGMDILTMNLPVKAQKILQLVVYTFMLAVLVMFVIKGFELAIMNWKRFMNSLKLSYGWATLSLPIGSILLIITILVKVGVTIKNFNNDDFTIKMHHPDTDPVKEAEE